MLLATICADAAAADELEHTATVHIENALEYDILMLFASAADSDFFGPELLGADDMLAAGEQRTFELHIGEDCFDYDVLAVDVDGFMYFELIELCPDDTVHIEIGEKGPLAEQPPFEHFIEIRIVNDHPVPLARLHASATDGRYYGANLLSPGETLEPGETMTVLLAESEAVSYNVVAETARGPDGAAEASASRQVHLHEYRGEGIETLRFRISAELFDSQ